MKRVVLPLICLLCLLFLTGPASAAFVKIATPESVNAGQTLEVTGTTTGVNPGYTFNVVLYKIGGSKSEIDRQQVIVQDDGNFTVDFKTDGLKSGTYSTEVATKGEDIFGGSSKRVTIFNVVNRADDFTVTSPSTQEFDGTLNVAGKIKDYADGGVRLTVTGSGKKTVYGPTWITTTQGVFSEEVPIASGGRYVVEVMDNSSYLWQTDFMVTGGIVTGTPTPVPSDGQPAGAVYSAAAPASRDAPAYFAVETSGGEITIATSSGTDWVMEYIDTDGTKTVVNEQGASAPESVTFDADAGTVYVKVTPQLYTGEGTVTVTAENVRSVAADLSVAEKFGDAVPEPTTQSPLPLWPVCAALVLGAVLFTRRA
ncbi:hypothetical protein RJ40_02605 [Methanofollis aquaemaris]|uniref:Uncharacterized protein n=1 Tax=Methanofollis aquaemaris TaxID=126734 RepID=A0A8A3S291_9EURY|nr:hypothetical protein [Methanofollis aquaemaris]QSZ66467.1 hypothetical protein RJ40_02605 [Methanofollis aquaemaris]